MGGSPLLVASVTQGIRALFQDLYFSGITNSVHCGKRLHSFASFLRAVPSSLAGLLTLSMLNEKKKHSSFSPFSSSFLFYFNMSDTIPPPASCFAHLWIKLHVKMQRPETFLTKRLPLMNSSTAACPQHFKEKEVIGFYFYCLQVWEKLLCVNLPKPILGFFIKSLPMKHF